ncbi:MAG: PilZ domain-containing protein [Desulfamplus sp.]|nr:PilZ domain-containing protein [Desulfamplus sp.]MBF0413127.1 PilZ domain-containing protein [Desulfamplus sp.]
MLDLFTFFKRTKRNAERVPVKVIVPVEVMFKYHYENRDYMGLLKDISVNGFGFFASNFLEPGKIINLEVILECKNNDDADFKWVALKEYAIIKWVTINKSSKPVDYDVGCEFTEPVDENREKLAKLLNYILEKSSK